MSDAIMSQARLFLEIASGKQDQIYLLTPHDPDPRVATRAWRIRKAGGRVVYDVAINKQGHTSCTCPDAVYRDHECKHILAIKAMGLLPKG